MHCGRLQPARVQHANASGLEAEQGKVSRQTVKLLYNW